MTPPPPTRPYPPAPPSPPALPPHGSKVKLRRKVDLENGLPFDSVTLDGGWVGEGGGWGRGAGGCSRSRV